MSFTSKATGTVYQPGYFLENAEDAIRETKQIKQLNATTAENGAKYVKMGTVYPANDNTAVGIVYEDVDVTSGDMPGSVVTRGTVYESRLPVKIDSKAKIALTDKGFYFIAATEAATVRPY